MKKILLAVLVSFISFTTYAQTQLSSKMTKGLEVEVDDFNGGIKYTAKSVGLSVLSKLDSCVFIWVLNCSDLTPAGFSKVQILVNGKVTEINFTLDEYKEYAETIRVPRNTFSGGKMATTFINEDRYIAEIKLDASKYLDLLYDIVNDKNDVKIRFSGNKDYDGIYNKKKKVEIKAILDVSKALSDI